MTLHETNGEFTTRAEVVLLADRAYDEIEQGFLSEDMLEHIKAMCYTTMANKALAWARVTSEQ